MNYSQTDENPIIEIEIIFFIVTYHTEQGENKEV